MRVAYSYIEKIPASTLQTGTNKNKEKHIDASMSNPTDFALGLNAEEQAYISCKHAYRTTDSCH
jgi:hypothetical protein